MKKLPLYILLGVGGIIVVAAVVSFVYRHQLSGAWTGLQPADENIADLLEHSPPAPTSSTPAEPAPTTVETAPLKLPVNFKITLFANNLPGARVLAFDGLNNLLVSQTGEGQITMLEVKDGIVREQLVLLSGLKNPHGLAVDPQDDVQLYYATEDSISTIRLYSEFSEEDDKPIMEFPGGKRHYTRTLGFGSDKRLYVSIGSSCNVCNEEDERYASIYSLNSDGSDVKQFARGLRNTVFFTWHPQTNELWGTDMGRDFLGDGLPPDEINIIKEGQNYGWPTCYGKNIHDTDFDKNTYIRNPCLEPLERGSVVDLPAHSSPLGVSFAPPSWPAEFKNDLFVALHGSWNSTVPVGYKIIRVKFDNDGRYEGTEDFVTGWLKPDNKILGRPVDIKIHGDSLYVSDDKAGAVYRIDYISPSKPSAPTEKTTSSCRVTGCSGEICDEKDMMSVCIYKEEFACYKTAKCERQKNGKCGWTETPELKECLENK